MAVFIERFVGVFGVGGIPSRLLWLPRWGGMVKATRWNCCLRTPKAGCRTTDGREGDLLAGVGMEAVCCVGIRVGILGKKGCCCGAPVGCVCVRGVGSEI